MNITIYREIAFLVSKNLYNKTKPIRSDTVKKSKAYEKFYGKYNFKVISISGTALFPINGIATSYAKCFSQEICNYTIQGRSKIHNNLKGVNQKILKYIMESSVPEQSTEYNDNRISLYVGQYGLCGITQEPLKIGDMEVHHKKPKSANGSDNYRNLIFVTNNVHKLIHATKQETIRKYLEITNLTEKGFKKLNKLRLMVGNCVIELSI
jgi:RNA-directed DNA polymerase